MQSLIIIMEDSRTLFCSSKYPWARKRIFSKLTVWASAFKKVRQPWYCDFPLPTSSILSFIARSSVSCSVVKFHFVCLQSNSWLCPQFLSTEDSLYIVRYRLLPSRVIERIRPTWIIKKVFYRFSDVRFRNPKLLRNTNSWRNSVVSI